MSEKAMQWGSRLGVVLAVAGSAVGLGNFLRFPGTAAANGGGAFMVPYFVALLLVGIPLAWAEWAMGRYAGTRGFHSAPGVFASLCRNRYGSFLGIFALLIPMMVFTYYVLIESWCLGYAWYYLTGAMHLEGEVSKFSDFFTRFTGQSDHGKSVDLGHSQLLIFVCIVFAINYWLIYRGLNKGIETVCKFAMPLMAFCAVCVLIRVLTLGTPNPALPDQSVAGGLNFMWNPDWNALANPKTWLAATGQIFFSLSVGFGVIINYASYLRRKDDIALSSLTSCSTNEFFEVCLGGLITIPAAFIFLGPAVSQFTGSSFAMGFKALPNVFASMPGGQIFGFIWFFMLFLAAITSSLSMLQPVNAFFEEGLGFKRLGSTFVLLLVGGSGTAFVLYYSKDLIALDTIDFWCGTFLITVLALIQSFVYAAVFGAGRGEEEMDRGALIRVPRLVRFVLQYLSPLFLLVIVAGTLINSGPDYVKSLSENPVAARSLVVIGIVFAMLLLMIAAAIVRWNREGKFAAIESGK